MRYWNRAERGDMGDHEVHGSRAEFEKIRNLQLE